MHDRAAVRPFERRRVHRALEPAAERAEIERTVRADKSRKIGKCQRAEEVLIRQVHLPARYIRENAEPARFQPNGSRRAAVHTEQRAPRDLRAGYVRLEIERRALGNEHGAEALGEIIRSGALRLARAGRRRVLVLYEIFVVCRNVHVRLVIRIRYHRFARSVRLDHALCRRVTLGNTHLGHRPVGGEAQRHVDVGERRTAAEPAHSHHLIGIVIGGRRGVEFELHSIYAVVAEHGIGHRKHGVRRHYIIGKFRAPKPVTLGVLVLFYDLRRLAVLPLGVAAVPVGWIVGNGVAQHRAALSEKPLYRGGRGRAQPLPAAERRGDEHAAVVILAAVDVLIDSHAESLRGHRRLRVGVVIFARGKPPDNVTEVIERGVVLGQRAVRRRRERITHALRRAFGRYPAAPRIAREKQHRNGCSHESERRRDDHYFPFGSLFMCFFMYRHTTFSVNDQ